LNYRHSFHAGNFADVMKHVLLSRILAHLNAKDSAYRVIDLHGGAGIYDLGSGDAERTGEWRQGIALFEAEAFSPEIELLLTPYRSALAEARALHGPMAYPGSPLIARFLTRHQDVVLANEKHPETCRLLRAALAVDPRCKVLELDASVALRANVPPRERRGLVLSDPPFERHDEFAVLVKDIAAAHAKWPTGQMAIWYPLKDPGLAGNFITALVTSGVTRLLRLELTVHDQPTGMGSCGLLVINPPWRLADEAAILLPALAARLATGPRSSYRCEAILPDG
jgi:23S rRNA (adenine2030-N6)-methyltransferase